MTLQALKSIALTLFLIFCLTGCTGSKKARGPFYDEFQPIEWKVSKVWLNDSGYLIMLAESSEGLWEFVKLCDVKIQLDGKEKMRLTGRKTTKGWRFEGVVLHVPNMEVIGIIK